MSPHDEPARPNRALFRPDAAPAAPGAQANRPKRLVLTLLWLAVSLAASEGGGRLQAAESSKPARHWAFIPPVRPNLPPAATHVEPGQRQNSPRPTAFARNPIDQFIGARLEREKLTPSPEADLITLTRRVTLDLTGLAPTPEEVDTVLSDLQPGAYERLVDRLLVSPHYGERWGRHWLDVARYADSNGYSIDAPRSVWKYRDWVIQALNADLAYDQFVVEQIAGDLLPEATLEHQIASGFHRHTQINQEGGIDPEQFRVESVIDRVNTTATAFLGLTLGCAQCHDHKFDPISQREYYQFFAFFNNTAEDGHGKGAPEGMLEVPGAFEREETLAKDLAETEGDLGRYLDNKGSLITEWETTLTPAQREKLPEPAQRAIGSPWHKRTTAQKRAAYSVFRPEDPDFKSRHAKLSKLERREPKPITTLVMRERPEPRETFIFIKGDFTRPSDKVTPGVLAVLHAFPAATRRGESSPSAERARPSNSTPASEGTNRAAGPTRLDLARWLVAPENPLFARVLVNRVWQQYFGRGLVETENDFGTQGTPPSHPDLLDWLACEFMQPQLSSPARPATPWSLKHLHRLIVSSATYRQSSRARPELANVDPNNRLLGRQTRLRLDAEVVRDVCLAASGLLSTKIGGPSVFPPQPDGVMKLGQLKRDWNVSAGPDRYRRGLYTHLWRATPHPTLSVFDAPDAFSTCTRRLRSNTPLQALTLLNDEAFVECATALARRLIREGPSSHAARLKLAFRLCLARPPAPSEATRLLDLLEAERQVFTQAPEEAAALVGQTGPKPGHPTGQADLAQLAAWTTVARVLLNLDETITRE